MNLDPKYMISPNLQEYFVDKITGLPLANGVVTYYSDTNRTQLKPVYELSGSGSSPVYTPLPNPMTLTNVGTTANNDGDDVRVYYCPYDANGDVELYYITVESSGGTLQLTRAAWPNYTSNSPTSAQEIINYIPNGQFLAHTDIPATQTLAAGTITQPVTIIAQGGWTFERPPLSTATDLVTFLRYNPTNSPTGNPRYAVRIVNSVPGGDAYKDLCIKFPDANMFASDTDQYTLYFEAISNAGSSTLVVFSVFKYYGAGGSPSTNDEIITFSILNSYAAYQESFVFGDNIGKTIGTANDDYVQLKLTFPLSAVFDVTLTNFVLSNGANTIQVYPEDTNADVFSRAVAGYMPTPAHDGSDFYLPMVATPEGVKFLNSQVGKLFASTYGTVEIDELLADGAGYLVSSVNSTSKIPYSRLAAKYWNSTTSTYRFGSGPSYVMAYISAGNSAQIFLTTNQLGAVTSTAEGSGTGFAFADVHTGDAAAFGVRTFVYNGGLYLITTAPTFFIALLTTAGTSGFTPFTLIKNSIITGFSALQIGTLAAAGLAGLYFRFEATSLKYVWYRVNGSGVDPAPAGTGIRVDLLSTDTAQDVAMKTASAIMGYQSSTIICNAASTFSGGSYFTFTAVSQLYVVWYTKDGVGTKPVVSNAFYIQVAVLSGDTAAQVASKTRIAINQVYVAVPDARGLFLRGYDPNTQWDPDVATRFNSVNYTNYGNNIGDLELDYFYNHTHGWTQNSTQGHIPYTNQLTTGGSGGPIAEFSNTGITNVEGANWNVTSITNTGGNETRPINMNVLWVVKY